MKKGDGTNGTGFVSSPFFRYTFCMRMIFILKEKRLRNSLRKNCVNFAKSVLAFTASFFYTTNNGVK